MKIEQMNFRNLAYNYVLFYNINPARFDLYTSSYPNEPGDNAVLTYGYIDNEAGLSFEMLCCARRYPDGRIEFRPGSQDTSLKIRYEGIFGDVETLPYRICFDEYQGLVDIITEAYGGGTDLEKIRRDTTFDAYRYPENPDDIQALLFKPGIKNEMIWVRTSHIEDGKIAGELLNEPDDPAFGLSMGDTVKLIPLGKADKVLPVVDFPWLYR